MIKFIFQKLLQLFGRNYKIDVNIPNSLYVFHLKKRFIMLLRGYIYYKRNIFLGKNTKIINIKNIILGKNISINDFSILDGVAFEKIIIGNNINIGKYCTISCTSHLSKLGKGFSLGNNSSIGDYSFFGSSGGIYIGNDVIIGQYVSFHSQNHNFKDSTVLIRDQGVTSKGIILGNNIWVGAKVTFLDGVKIGDNCVIAAGAVVKDNFENNCIIGGVPAKVLKKIE